MNKQHLWMKAGTLLAVAALVAGACGAQTTTAPTATAPTGTPIASAAPFTGDTWNAGCANYPANSGEIDHVTAKDRYTVEIGLCHPDAAFLSKIAFISNGIMSKAWLDQTKGGGDALDKPNGTGPLLVKAGDWVKGDHLTLTAFDNFWGDKSKMGTYVVRWSTEAAQRVLELQSGTVDGIDNPGPTDFQTISSDANLKLYTREALNILYLGMNRDNAPFDSEKIRQAIAMGIDRDRIVKNFYPAGSEVATHFAPCPILGACEGADWYSFDATAAKTLLAEGLKDDGLSSFPKVKIYYRNVFRGYLPNPPQIAAEFQAQLKDNLGIDAVPTEMESGAFLTAANEGKLTDGFFLLGWLQDYPDMTDWVDVHFGRASLSFGSFFPGIVSNMAAAGQITDENLRKAFYADVNNLLKQHVPMVPIVHAASADAFKATVDGGYADPNTEERLYTMSISGQDQLTFMQSAEPLSLFPADESDGESLRMANQIYQPLYDYKLGSTEPVPALADKCEPSSDGLTWTCTLHQGVTFQDGAAFDANDVVATFAANIDVKNPNHKGNSGDYYYSYTLWGSLLNAPAS